AWLLGAGGARTVDRRRKLLGRARLRRLGRDDESTSPAAAHLAALAAGRARLVRGPFMRGSLHMSGAAALTRDLALFFGGHRREPSPFFPFSNSHRSASVLFQVTPRTDPSGPAQEEGLRRRVDAARRAASPAPPVGCRPAFYRAAPWRRHPFHPSDYQRLCHGRARGM